MAEKILTEEQKNIASSLYKNKDHFEDSIFDKGWDDLVLGAAVFSFEGDIDHTVVNVQPEGRVHRGEIR